MNYSTTAEIALPPVNRDMKVLERSFFQKTIPTSALTVFDPRNLSAARNKVTASNDVLQSTTIKPIIEDETSPGTKCILLKPHVKASDPMTWSEKWSDLVENGTAKVRPFDLKLTYDDWSMGDILDAILPEVSSDDEQNPSGFAQVGHVAHLNLRDQFLPYKHLIGQVLLDKNSQVKTVINKIRVVGTDSVFRTFPYEVLAGPDDLNVTVRHIECEFKFNFSEVYWNTRLGHEHERLVSSFKEGEAVCDVMAGVGPFAIPAAKRKIWVYANDLNPASYKGLHDAININKVSAFARPFNMDGADFIKFASTELLRERRTYDKMPWVNFPRKVIAEQKQALTAKAQSQAIRMQEPPTFDHFVMNLPASAIEFLYAFKGLYAGKEGLFKPIGGRNLPMVHVHAFQARRDDENEEKEELRQRLSQQLGFDFTGYEKLTLHRARLVAPNKLYYCASFRLPPEVAFAQSGWEVRARQLAQSYGGSDDLLAGLR